MSAVRASSRVSISWKDDLAYEDTDTLVLTIHDFSLDLRVFVAGARKGKIDWSTVAKVSEANGSSAGKQLHLLSVRELTVGIETPILKWDHLIDSRPDSGVEDQGSFAALPNGDVTETGRMFNPATNMIEPYVETWRRFTLDPESPYCVLELVPDKVSDMALYLGRVGDHDLSCGQYPSGAYVARRDFKGVPVFHFGGWANLGLPSLPKSLPKEWGAGEIVVLGQSRFIVRHLGRSVV